MSLPANALTTTATMGAELGLSGSTLTAATPVLERLIGMASNAIEAFCGRTFGRQTVSNERHKGHGGPRMVLPLTPVSMVLGITLDGEAVDPTSYYLEADSSGVSKTGFVFNVNGWEWTAAEAMHVASPTQLAGTEEAAYLVSYIGGYVLPKDDSQTTPRTLPYDLEQAAIISVVTIYRGRGKYQNIVQETTTGDTKVWTDYSLPANAKALLKPYVRSV